MIYITHVRIDPDSPAEHQHITDLRWLGPASTATNDSTLGQIVKWVKHGGDAWVREGFANLKLVVAIGAPRHVRTVANDTLTDHLLKLPRF